MNENKTSAPETLLLPINKFSPLVSEGPVPENVVVQKKSPSMTENSNQQHRFGPRDLTALQKSLEKEIDGYELLLTEEIEKRKKYRVQCYF